MQPVIVLIATADRFPSALRGRQNAISAAKGQCKVGMGNTCVCNINWYFGVLFHHNNRPREYLCEYGTARHKLILDIRTFIVHIARFEMGYV